MACIPRSSRKNCLSEAVAYSVGVLTNSRPFLSWEAYSEELVVAPISWTMILVDKPEMADGLVVVVSVLMFESIIIKWQNRNRHSCTLTYFFALKLTYS